MCVFWECGYCCVRSKARCVAVELIDSTGGLEMVAENSDIKAGLGLSSYILNGLDVYTHQSATVVILFSIRQSGRPNPLGQS